MGQRYLDTYALIEIAEGNKAFFEYVEDDFVLCDATLIELYNVLLRAKGTDIAERWYRTLQLSSLPVHHTILKKALLMKKKYAKENMSLIDTTGYCYAQHLNIPFVTGDRAFEGLAGVDFRK